MAGSAADRGVVVGRPRLRVLLADDEEDIRALLRTALEAHGDIQVVGEASDGGDAVRLARDLRPGAVVSDLRMPTLGGDAVLSALREALPSTVLVLCSADPPPEAVAASRADEVVDKRELDWMWHLVWSLLDAAGRDGNHPWPQWERRAHPRRRRR